MLQNMLEQVLSEGTFIRKFYVDWDSDHGELVHVYQMTTEVDAHIAYKQSDRTISYILFTNHKS